ncbi:MAG: chromate transporter, partial [Acidimicrobiia bacterium]|nr:chromate transporter [Acidimicrobiia bacterium]
YGVLPVIVAIIAHAVVALGRVSLVSPVGAFAAAAALAGFVAGVHELLVLVVAGSAAALWANRRRLRLGRFPVVLLLAGGEPGRGSAGPSLWRLLLVFLEIGSILYGSGYVLVAYLQRNLVTNRGWLSEQELLDAISVGQVTPGPVFTTATFAGWQIEGWAGAAVATVGIFAPSFLFVALLGRIVPWMRTHATARAFLDGVVAASLGMMAGVLVELVDDAISDLATAALAAGALAVLVATRLNSAWLIGGGVMVGLAHRVIA